MPKQVLFMGKKDKATGFVLAFDGSGVVQTLRAKNRDRQIEGKLPVGPVEFQHKAGKEAVLHG